MPAVNPSISGKPKSKMSVGSGIIIHKRISVYTRMSLIFTFFSPFFSVFASNAVKKCLFCVVLPKPFHLSEKIMGFPRI